MKAYSSRALMSAAFLAAASFGSFWGAWGSSIPRIRQQAGVDDTQLGLALLVIGAAALPAMLVTGRALDRWGVRLAVGTVISLAVAGVCVAVFATSFAALCVCLALVGATSGAVDVAMNSIGGRAEELVNKPIIARCGGVFSAAVVFSCLLAGAATHAGAPLWAPFGCVMVLSVAASAAIARALPSQLSIEHTDQIAPHGAARQKLMPLLIIGLLGLLAMASENAHQSWSALFLEDELGAVAGVSAVAPAVFAGVVAITRFSIGIISRDYARLILLLGASAAAIGTAVVGLATNFAIALAGLAIAAMGTAVLHPTLLSVVSRNIPESHRGRATSMVTIIAYIGFLAGPVYVGMWSGAAGLRNAMFAIAAVAAVLAVLIVPLLTASGFTMAARDIELAQASEPVGRSSAESGLV